MSKKANEELLNSLHLMTAEKLARLLKESEGEPELQLKVIKEISKFLKDNNVSADVEVSRPLRELEQQIKIAELPFDVGEE